MKEMQARERMNRRDNINTTQQTTTPNSQYQQQSVIQGDQFVKYGGTGVQQKFSTSKVEELNPRSFKSRTQDIGPNLYIRKGMQRTQMTQRIQDSDPQNRAYQPASSGQLDQTWLRPYKGLPGYEDFGGKPGLRIFFAVGLHLEKKE
ncbi:MAG: hypothetical protein EZS28_013124 [Streblomastix strix]|uniref:Uncharacterized protein n=1 Tax=Streblomastix strix TaxID=222440 RepID=A0A5J4WAE5_9EUKA|nr:MAG: hypothetical protein EZS28_013124 [Streblomastix strix]